MIRCALLLGVFAGAMLMAPVAAQVETPAAHTHDAMFHQSRPMTFTDPATSMNQAAGGQDCVGHGANAAQTTINPITGKPQAAPIIAVPLSTGGGSVASATTHALQTQACAQGR